jgi:hypothetical protein
MSLCTHLKCYRVSLVVAPIVSLVFSLVAFTSFAVAGSNALGPSIAVGV